MPRFMMSGCAAAAGLHWLGYLALSSGLLSFLSFWFVGCSPFGFSALTFASSALGFSASRQSVFSATRLLKLLCKPSTGAAIPWPPHHAKVIWSSRSAPPALPAAVLRRQGLASTFERQTLPSRLDQEIIVNHQVDNTANQEPLQEFNVLGQVSLQPSLPTLFPLQAVRAFDVYPGNPFSNFSASRALIANRMSCQPRFLTFAAWPKLSTWSCHA